MILWEQGAGVAARVANGKDFQQEVGFYLSFGRLFLKNLGKHIKREKTLPGTRLVCKIGRLLLTQEGMVEHGR